MWMNRNFRLVVGHDSAGDWNNHPFHMLHMGLIMQIGNLLWLWFKSGADILCLSSIVVKSSCLSHYLIGMGCVMGYVCRLENMV